MILPIAPAEKLIRAGGGERVGDSAARALAEALEEIGKRIGARAVRYARHAGRKTVTAEDIKLAVSEMPR